LEPLKAPEILVEAAALLAPTVPDVEVVFVGASNRRRDGKPYADWTAQLAGTRQAPCRFVGRVAESEMREWYGKARVVALTSRHDNFPVSGLEAMAAGRPLVVTSAAGVAELLGNGGGAVVPPLDAHALAEALHPYLIDADLAGRAGEVARETVARECDPDAIAQQREAVYMEATEAWRRRRLRRPGRRGASRRVRC
jgi:glycosyltransferase involved in cell wall biosynthesis